MSPGSIENLKEDLLDPDWYAVGDGKYSFVGSLHSGVIQQQQKDNNYFKVLVRSCD